MTNELLIIKLGGAAITDKNKTYTAKPKVIASILREIKKIDKPVIIIHGAGSFAHNLAKEYQVAHGKTDEMDLENQLWGITKIRNSMQRLHQIVLDAAEEEGLRTFSIPISSTLITKGSDQIESSYFHPFDLALEHNFIPVSYGDMSFDSTDAGFLVVSGDRIIKLLVEYFKDRNIHVIFGSDVDGLYDKDPRYGDANLIKSLSYDEIDEWISVAGESAGVDVTGGMEGKLRQIREIAQFVKRIDLINITYPSRLSDLLAGEDVLSTTFSA